MIKYTLVHVASLLNSIRNKLLFITRGRGGGEDLRDHIFFIGNGVGISRRQQIINEGL